MNLIFAFIISLVAQLHTAFSPYLHLCAFAPFLALVYLRNSWIFSLWCAFLCGFIMDMLSSETFFGFHAWSYVLAMGSVYRTKKHLYSQSVLALFLATAFFSSLATFFQAWITFKSLFGIHFFLTDLVIMPLMDGVYSFVCFACPAKAYKEIKAFYRGSHGYSNTQ